MFEGVQYPNQVNLTLNLGNLSADFMHAIRVMTMIYTYILFQANPLISHTSVLFSTRRVPNHSLYISVLRRMAHGYHTSIIGMIAFDELHPK